jgi:hypothetical protein
MTNAELSVAYEVIAELRAEVERLTAAADEWRGLADQRDREIKRLRARRALETKP